MLSIFNNAKNVVVEDNFGHLIKMLETDGNIASKEDQTFYEDAGRVISIADGVAKVSGLATVTSGELVSFLRGVKGLF